jgi:hypothetical protein
MSKEVTEASLAITVAEAFGGKPPQWAVEARRRELREAGQPTMSMGEALDVTITAAFGRVADRERLAEAETVLATGTGSSGSAGTSALKQKMTALMTEVTSLAESRLGYSAERARLYAQGEALECRERASSVADAVKSLEMHRDVLVKRPMASTRAR